MERQRGFWFTANAVAAAGLHRRENRDDVFFPAKAMCALPTIGGRAQKTSLRFNVPRLARSWRLRSNVQAGFDASGNAFSCVSSRAGSFCLDTGDNRRLETRNMEITLSATRDGQTGSQAPIHLRLCYGRITFRGYPLELEMDVDLLAASTLDELLRRPADDMRERNPDDDLDSDYYTYSPIKRISFARGENPFRDVHLVGNRICIDGFGEIVLGEVLRSKNRVRASMIRVHVDEQSSPVRVKAIPSSREATSPEPKGNAVASMMAPVFDGGNELALSPAAALPVDSTSPAAPLSLERTSLDSSGGGRSDPARGDARNLTQVSVTGTRVESCAVELNGVDTTKEPP